jgi:hypothetical protein
MLLPAGGLALAYRLHDLAGYRRARIVRAKVNASAAIRSNLATLGIRLVLDFAPKTLSVRSVIYSVL